MKHQQLDDWSVPRMHWAFPRITATEIRWRRKVVERGSCVSRLLLLLLLLLVFYAPLVLHSQKALNIVKVEQNREL